MKLYQAVKLHRKLWAVLQRDPFLNPKRWYILSRLSDDIYPGLKQEFTNGCVGCTYVRERRLFCKDCIFAYDNNEKIPCLASKTPRVLDWLYTLEEDSGHKGEVLDLNELQEVAAQIRALPLKKWNYGRWH